MEGRPMITLTQEKQWDDLTIDEKVDRLRTVLGNMVKQVEDDHEPVIRKLMQHSHDQQGRLVSPLVFYEPRPGDVHKP